MIIIAVVRVKFLPRRICQLRHRFGMLLNVVYEDLITCPYLI